MCTDRRSRETSTWPHAVIFDLDGTLIDSAPDIADAVNAALAGRDIVIDSEMARRFLGDGARRFVARVLDAHGHEYDDAELDRLTGVFSERYQAHPCRNSTVFPGAVKALERLRQRNTRLAVCTNKPQPIAERVLVALGLAHYIDAVIGAGAHALKPDPAPLHACLRALDCAASQALYIGDMAVDRQAGHAAGLPVLLADFGYATSPTVELGADGVLADWVDLPAAIAALLSQRR